VRAMVSWKETLQVFPAILVVGGSFAATQWFWANHFTVSLAKGSARNQPCGYGTVRARPAGESRIGTIALNMDDRGHSLSAATEVVAGRTEAA